MKKVLKGKAKIKSSKHTASHHFGVTGDMSRMVGKVLPFDVNRDNSSCYNLGGWNWHPDDIVVITDEDVKIKYPNPEQFNVALLDL